MIGLRKVISSHPLMSGVANRVHAVSAHGPIGQGSTRSKNNEPVASGSPASAPNALTGR